MTAPTHVLIALAGVAVTGRLTGVVPNGPALLLLILGALTPDLDGEGAITRPGSLLRSVLGWRLARLLDTFTQILSGLIRIIFGHRGFCHSPLLGLILIGGGLAAQLPLLYWFGWGFLWHLVGDFLTPYGIPLLSPCSSRHFHGANIVTGSTAERLLFVALLVATITLGWPLLPDGVREAHLKLLQFLTR